MPGNWDFSGFSEGIDRGLVNRARNARMAKMDAIAAQDRDRRSAERAEDVGARERGEMRSDEATRIHNLGLGLGEPRTPQEVEMRAKLTKKNDLAEQQAQANIDYTNWRQHDKPTRDVVEQGITQKLKSIDAELDDLSAQESDRDLFSPSSWWSGKGLSDEQKAYREKLKTNKSRMLGIDRGGPKMDRKAIYIKARQEGKSEAEARALAGG